MATFKFESRHVELEFPGGIKHSLPLTDDMRCRVEDASKKLIEQTKTLRGRTGNAEDLETLCDYTLDAVDAILGEGAADQIMETKGDYSFLDCVDLFKFVTSEFTSAYVHEANAAKAKNGKSANGAQPKPSMSAPNHAKRRHRRRRQ